MSHLIVAALLLLAGTVAVYAIRCTWWPLRRCMRCRGKRVHPGMIRRSRTVLCRSCRGTGETIRLGRRVVDGIRTTRARARAAS